MAGRVLDALVEAHHDVRAQGQLDFHGALRGEKMRGAIQVRAKPHSILSYAAQRLQAHHLKTAAVGQDRVRPRHETVQPARLANQFVAGAKIKMIGVAQQDLHPQRFQLILRHALHRAAGAYGHKDGRLDHAMRGMQ